MTMSDTLIVISVIVGLGTSLTAIGLLFHALFPAWVGRAEGRIRSAPVRTSILGAVLGTFALAVVSVLVANPLGPVKFAGIVGLLAVLCVSFAGAAGLARFIGGRLPSSADVDRPWKPVIRGWVVIYLSSLLPVLGWFVFLPAALLIGLGAAVSAVARRPVPAVPQPAPARVEQEVAA